MRKNVTDFGSLTLNEHVVKLRNIAEELFNGGVSPSLIIC